MPTINIPAPSEEISVYLDDLIDEVEVDLDDYQICELVDEDPDMVLHHIWSESPAVLKEWIFENLDPSQRLALVTEEKKKAKGEA